MGNYTSIVVSARLKASTPNSVLLTIKDLASGDVDVKSVLGESAHRNPLGGSSAYFPEPSFELQKSGFAHEREYSLNIVSNLKNYNGEIQLFIDWLRPHVDSGHGQNDWWAIVTYEEAEAPEIHYL